MKTTRRKMLKGTAAVLATTTAAGAAVYAEAKQDPDAGLLALSDRYWALQEKSLRLDRSTPGMPHAEWYATYNHVDELDAETMVIAERIAEATAHTPMGLLAKLRIVRAEAGFKDGVIMSKKWSRDDAMVALGLWTAMEDAALMAKKAGGAS